MKPPEIYEKYDNYDAYEIPRTEFLNDFIDRHQEYVINGGEFGLPITFLDKVSINDYFQIVELLRPILNGKILYMRIICKLDISKESVVVANYGDRTEYRLLIQRR